MSLSLLYSFACDTATVRTGLAPAIRRTAVFRDGAAVSPGVPVLWHMATAPPPRMRLPATLQTLAGLVAPETWVAYLLRRYRGETVVDMKLVGLGDIATVSDAQTIKQVMTADRGVVRAGE